MTQQHIDNNTLSLFVKTTSLSDHDMASHEEGVNIMHSTLYQEVLDHLAYCEDCRNQASIITTLHDGWIDIRQPSELTENQHQTICDYVDGLLPIDEADEVRTLIKNHPDAMKAALHYQSHVTTMRDQLSRKASEPPTKAATQLSPGNLYHRLMAFCVRFFSIPPAMAYTMSATAVLLIAVFLLIQQPQLQPKQTMIASYQDDPMMQFTDSNKLPGVGFFAQSGNTSKPFEDVRIELIAKDTIKMTWPEVDGAALYKMRIQVFNHGKKTILKENSVQTNHTTFVLEADDQKSNTEADNIRSQNRRYEWVLYGNTKDDRMFYAAGGFIISKAVTDGESDYDTW